MQIGGSELQMKLLKGTGNGTLAMIGNTLIGLLSSLIIVMEFKTVCNFGAQIPV